MGADDGLQGFEVCADRLDLMFLGFGEKDMDEAGNGDELAIGRDAEAAGALYRQVDAPEQVVAGEGVLH